MQLLYRLAHLMEAKWPTKSPELRYQLVAQWLSIDDKTQHLTPEAIRIISQAKEDEAAIFILSQKQLKSLQQLFQLRRPEDIYTGYLLTIKLDTHATSNYQG